MSPTLARASKVFHTFDSVTDFMDQHYSSKLFHINFVCTHIIRIVSWIRSTIRPQSETTIFSTILMEQTDNGAELLRRCHRHKGVTYTCRYSSGHLIPIIHNSVM